MKHRSLITSLSIAALTLAAAVGVVTHPVSAKPGPGKGGSSRAFDAEITQHSQTMLASGRKIFRYDTFGSEAFWGDALGLHKAIAGEKNGGVGAGVCRRRVAVGLKVGADALAGRVVKPIKAGKVNSTIPGHGRAAEAHAVGVITAFIRPRAGPRRGNPVRPVPPTVDDSSRPDRQCLDGENATSTWAARVASPS